MNTIPNIRLKYWLIVIFVVTNIIKINSQTYCTNLYNIGCHETYQFYIRSFCLGSLSHLNTNCSTNGYGLFNTHSFSLLRGTTYPFYLSMQGAQGSDMYAGMWIDFNDDGDFDDVNEFLGAWQFYGSGNYPSYGGNCPNPNSSAGSQSGNAMLYNPLSGTKNASNYPTISIPANAPHGNHRLRIRLVYYYSQSAGTSCITYDRGETQDYTVTIDSPLPVELINFSGKCTPLGVRLEWATASETNNAFYLIEKSEDALDWEFVDRVSSTAGNSNIIQHYSTFDSQMSKKAMYYRLTQQDIDGTTEIFAPIAVHCSENEDNIRYYFSPNPTFEKPQLTIISKEKLGKVVVVFQDMTGKSLAQEEIFVQAGEQKFTFNIDFNAGVYLASIQIGDLCYPAEKLIIVN